MTPVSTFLGSHDEGKLADAGISPLKPCEDGEEGASSVTKPSSCTSIEHIAGLPLTFTTLSSAASSLSSSGDCSKSLSSVVSPVSFVGGRKGGCSGPKYASL